MRERCHPRGHVTETSSQGSGSRRHKAWCWIALLAPCLLPTAASASSVSPEAMDTVATVLAWLVVCVVPIAAIVLFWLLHVLPQRIARRRRHPQLDAIKTLCLLSLVFGGLLWPIAWLWAYTKPTAARQAYGAQEHEDHFLQMREKWRAGELSDNEIDALREELDTMAENSPLPGKLKTLRRELATAQDALNAALSRVSA